MARPGKSPEQNEEQPLLASEQLTYLPGPDDPQSTKWHGIVFHANVPKSVTKADLIEQARANRFFKVGPFDPAKDTTGDAPSMVDPKTSNQYRAHVVEWIKTVASINEMIARWIKEQPMRDACEVGSDDYSYIGTLFRPKMHQLALAAGLGDQKLAELWATNGVFQLPF